VVLFLYNKDGPEACFGAVSTDFQLGIILPMTAFFHPDYTVGPGFSPDPPSCGRVAGLE
jgi:hypothetical protein